MKQLVVFALVLSSASVSAQSAAASTNNYTPQDKVLSKEGYGNFACKVNKVTITTENPGDAAEPVIGPKDVLSRFEEVATLEWAHVMQASFSSFDGRNEEKVLGTPGGDMGEFIQAVAAFNKVSGKVLGEDDIQRAFEKYLKVMTRTKFFYETDERAYIKLAVATGCRNLHVSDMGSMKHKKELYLTKLAVPDFIGDPFIKFLATNATDLDISLDAILYSLGAYHKVLWTNPSPLSQKLCYLEVKGSQKQEQALVNIRTAPWCVDQGLAPMISPQTTCAAPIFVNHPDHVRLLRREIVSVLTDNDETRDRARDVLAAYNAMAESNLERFWNDYGAGLPVYTVEFGSLSPVFTTDVSPSTIN